MKTAHLVLTDSDVQLLIYVLRRAMLNAYKRADRCEEEYPGKSRVFKEDAEELEQLMYKVKLCKLVRMNEKQSDKRGSRDD